MELKLATYVHQPKELHKLDLKTIEHWANNNPFAINIWMIYCKKLLQLNHPNYKDVLRKTAFFAPNRAQLHAFLYDENWRTPSTHNIFTSYSEKNNATKANSIEQEILASAIDSSISMEVSSFDISEIEKLPPIHTNKSEEDKQFDEPKNKAEHQKPSSDSTSDFLRWLGTDESELDVVKAPALSSNDTKSEEAIITENSNAKAPDKNKKISKEELLQRFVQLEPKITPKKVAMYNPVNMAKQSTVEDYSLVTETLAKIYVKQQQFEKAKKAYQSLILRFPEKKSYFADRLKKMDELTQQKKNK